MALAYKISDVISLSNDFVEKFSKEYELEVLEILDLRHA